MVVKLKICLVGDPAVGKTSLIRRYVKDQFNDEYLKTVGAKIAKKTLTIPLNGTEIRVDMILWDIAGMGGKDSILRRDYLYGTQGVLAVCDATDSKTISGLGDWIEAVRKLAGDVPIRIVINKTDMDDGALEEEPRTFPSADSGTSCIRTSAKTGDNVERAFYDLAKSIVLDKIIARMRSGETAPLLRSQ
ncbi:MAG: Rab family GTPase [Thermoplasmata archaeon]